MISVQIVGDAILLPVKAQPGARRDAIVGEHGERLKIAVTQVAEKGKANDALCELVADSLGVARSRVTVMSGLTSAQKVLRVEGLSFDVACGWLEGLGIPVRRPDGTEPGDHRWRNAR